MGTPKTLPHILESTESAAMRSPNFEYFFRLYVTGATPASARAVVTIRKTLDQHLKGRYRLEILNVSENVAQARENQIVAIPTLIQLLPMPVRRFIGDMSNIEPVVRGLALNPGG